MAQLSVAPSPFFCSPGILQGHHQHHQVRRIYTLSHCSVSSRFGLNPKTGAVGTQRFKDGAVPGTYWSDNANLGEDVKVAFNKGSETVNTTATVGENLLRVAERCGVMLPNADFCFEGSCCHCEMEVVGGAAEVGPNGSGKVDELVRSCLCPLPCRKEDVKINLVSEDDVWGERVL